MNTSSLAGTALEYGWTLPRLHRGRSLWADVHVAVTKLEVEQVLHHRYDVYSQDRGTDYAGLNHENRILYDPDDNDAILLYTCDTTGCITGSMRILLERADDVANTEQATFIRLRPRKSGHSHAAQLSRMCSTENRRGGPQLLRMMLYAYFFGINNGVKFAFLSSMTAKKSLYERLGYAAIGAEQNGLIPMAIDLRDWRPLKEARSPYQSILALLEAPPLQTQNTIEKKNRDCEASLLAGLDG